jgi:hypothetical protein
VLVFSSWFIFLFFFFFFFLQGEVSLPRGLWWFILGVAWCSPVDLLNVWSQCLMAQQSCFINVMWCGEALYEIGVQGVALFLQSVALASQQGFGVSELMLFASEP